MRRVLISSVSVSFALAGAVTQAALAQARTTTPAPAYDVSYTQCGGALPSGGNLGVVGVNDGLPWSSNPCLGSEYLWAAQRPQGAQFYMNTANPETASSYWTARAGSGPRACGVNDLSNPASTGCAYNYGWNSAADAVSRAAAATSTATASSRAWWLDVETGNSWNGTSAANAADVQGSIDYLQGIGAPSVGVYSTTYQWGQITGGYQLLASASHPQPVDWVAGASSARVASNMCASSYSFSGGRVTMSQFPSGGFDADYIC